MLINLMNISKEKSVRLRNKKSLTG